MSEPTVAPVAPGARRRFADPDAAGGRAGGDRLPARRGAGHRRLPRPGHAPPAVPGGRGRRRQDRPGARAGRGHRPAHLPAAVLRGHRGHPGALRLGLRPAAAAPARRRGRARRRRSRAGSRPRSTTGGSCSPARCCRRWRTPPACCSIDEVDRADDEFEAFLLEVLSDFTISIPELGTIRAVDPAARRPHLQPHPRGARRPQAPLPLPLAAAPGLRPRGRDPAPPAARR